MKKIINPFDNYCFGCSPQNIKGLQMEFFYDTNNKEMISRWQANSDFQGYPNVLHGGIQTTMMDEIAAWSVYIILETAGVTKSLKVDFINPLYLTKGDITLKARLHSAEKSVATFAVKIFDGEEKLCSEGIVDYFVYPETIARRKFDYPGLEAFFEKK